MNSSINDKMMLKNCFGCMSLRKGSIFLASLNIVSAIVATILLLVALNDRSLKFQRDELAFLTWFTFVGIYIYMMLMAFFASVMIYGSVHRIPRYVFPWMALTFASLVLNVAFNLAGTIIFVKYLELVFILAGYLYIMLCTALQIYFALIAYSHYHDLLAEQHSRQDTSIGNMNVEMVDLPTNPHRKVQTPGADYRGAV